MRDAKLHILQHALGLDAYGRGREYRNRYVAGPGHHSFAALEEMVASGLMERHGPGPLFGGDFCYVVTDRGRRFVREHRPASPKLTRSQERYRRFLDADCGLSFGEWLREVSR